MVFLLLPALGELESLKSPKLWILLVIGFIATFNQPSYQATDKGPSQDRGTALQIVWSIYITQFLAIIEAIYLRYPESFEWTSLTIVSLVVAVAGLVLRSWSVKVLGDFFTWHVKILPEHTVIQNGPYRFVRHPSYTGALLTYLFMPLFLGSVYSFALCLIILPLTFHRRIKLEEQELVKALGPPYEDYMERVGGLFPKIFS